MYKFCVYFLWSIDHQHNHFLLILYLMVYHGILQYHHVIFQKFLSLLSLALPYHSVDSAYLTKPLVTSNYFSAFISIDIYPFECLIKNYVPNSFLNRASVSFSALEQQHYTCYCEEIDPILT